MSEAITGAPGRVCTPAPSGHCIGASGARPRPPFHIDHDLRQRGRYDTLAKLEDGIGGIDEPGDTRDAAR